MKREKTSKKTLLFYEICLMLNICMYLHVLPIIFTMMIGAHIFQYVILNPHKLWNEIYIFILCYFLLLFSFFFVFQLIFLLFVWWYAIMFKQQIKFHWLNMSVMTLYGALIPPPRLNLFDFFSLRTHFLFC